jgi:hypothetical protein
VYQLIDFALLSLLVKYNLTIILLVGSIVVVGSIKSNSNSAGVATSTQPINETPVEIIGPIAVPVESAN